MNKSGIDQSALITLFAESTARQGEALRKAVADATLKALQGREMTLDGVRKVVKTVTTAASAGAARNPAGIEAVEPMLEKALSGIDAALLQAVEANRTALARFLDQGVALTDKPMKDAMAGLEKMEDVFFGAVAKASQTTGPMQAAWEQALSSMKMKGSDTGARAAETMQSLTEQARTTLRDSRASGMKAAEAMLQSYSALVSGVLIGMSEGMRAGGAKASSSAASPWSMPPMPFASAPSPAASAAPAAPAKKRARRAATKKRA